MSAPRRAAAVRWERDFDAGDFVLAYRAEFAGSTLAIRREWRAGVGTVWAVDVRTGTSPWAEYTCESHSLASAKRSARGAALIQARVRASDDVAPAHGTECDCQACQV